MHKLHSFHNPLMQSGDRCMEHKLWSRGHLGEVAQYLHIQFVQYENP